MREPVRDKGRLEHILEQLDNINEFIAEKSLEDLQNKKVLRFAVVKCLEIIGEAAYMLSLEFKEKHPEVSWNEIVKMRHVLVHGYYHISMPLLWAIITNDLPALRPHIEQHLETMK